MQTQFGDWSIALGIDWSFPSNLREVRAEKKRRAKDYFVLSSVGSQHWLGFHAPVPGKVYAAALLVAMVKPNAVVYFPVNEYSEGGNTMYSDAWVCAISDGMPVPGYDKVLPIVEARNTAIEWASLFPKAEMVGEISGAQSTLADVIGVVDEGLQSKAIQKKQIAVALLNKHGVSVARIAAVAVLAGVAVACFFGYQAYSDMKRKGAESQLSADDAARQFAMSSQEKARIEAEQKQKLAEFQGQLDAAKISSNLRPSVGALWSGFVTTRQALPVSKNGYKPQSVDCTPTGCRVTWLGAGRFTSAAGKLALPNVERNLTSDLSAVSVFPVVVGTDTMPASSAKTADELRFLFQSHFGLHAKNFQADASQPVVISPPAGLTLPPQTVADVGKWRVQIQGSAAVIDAKIMLGMLAKWPVRVQAIKYQPAASLVELEGEFVFLSDKKE